MTLYSVHCSVCKTDYSSKSEWNDHLTQDKHQNLAKQKCWSNSERDKCLVIYSSFEVTVTRGGAQKIIQYFSTNLWNWVTDFVNWEERPYFAIVQFESREKAEEIVSKVTKPDSWIDERRVQIKLASELWDLEWNSHLPRNCTQTLDDLLTSKRKQSPSIEPEPLLEPVTKKPKNDHDNANNVVPLVREGFKRVVGNLENYAKQRGWNPPEYQFTEHPTSKKGHSTWSCSVILNEVDYSPSDNKTMRQKENALRHAAYYCQEMLLMAAYQSDNDKPKESIAASQLGLDRTLWASCPVNSLQRQFWEVCETVTLSDEKYDMFLELGQHLEFLFCEVEPKTSVVLFRNFHLKLADPEWTTDNRLYFYVYNTGSGSYVMSQTTMKTVFANTRAALCAFTPITIPKVISLGPTFQYNCKGFDFTIVTSSYLFVELQLCRLLEYLCTFDNRCHSLIAVCWFWWKMNEVDVFKSSNDDLEVTSDPLTMEWLVIHYLCHEGILPSVREIQQRKHPEKNYRGVDIGFCADPKFVQEWNSRRNFKEICQRSDEYVQSVLELFQGFLKFFGETLATGKWILNTRDGEVLDMENFLTSACGKLETTKMTREDLFALRKIQKEDKCSDEFGMEDGNGIPDVYKVMESEKIDLRQFHLYMVHPFIYTWRFSMNGTSFKSRSGQDIHGLLHMMKLTAQQLDTYLKMRKYESGENSSEGSSENLKIALTLSKL